jgi:hypothetical protein
LVRDAGLRQPRQGSGRPAAAKTGSKRLIAAWEVASSQGTTVALPVVAGGYIAIPAIAGALFLTEGQPSSEVAS